MDTDVSVPLAFQPSAEGFLEPNDGELAKVLELIIKQRVESRMDTLEQVSPLALIDLLMIP
jgi:hypothetical protein